MRGRSKPIVVPFAAPTVGESSAPLGQKRTPGGPFRSPERGVGISARHLCPQRSADFCPLSDGRRLEARPVENGVKSQADGTDLHRRDADSGLPHLQAPRVATRHHPRCGCGCAGNHHLCLWARERQSVREEEVETLVGLSVGDDVTCRDNGAVNSGLHPEALVTFICRNATDEVYAATVSPDGRLTSLSGPVHLKPASG